MALIIQSFAVISVVLLVALVSILFSNFFRIIINRYTKLNANHSLLLGHVIFLLGYLFIGDTSFMDSILKILSSLISLMVSYLVLIKKVRIYYFLSLFIFCFSIPVSDLIYSKIFIHKIFKTNFLKSCQNEAYNNYLGKPNRLATHELEKKRALKVAKEYCACAVAELEKRDFFSEERFKKENPKEVDKKMTDFILSKEGQGAFATCREILSQQKNTAIKDDLQNASVRVVHNDSEKVLVIEGNIQQGMYDKLIDLTYQNRGDIAKVAIFSNGGDVNEAIKIGTAIRVLRLSTVIPSGKEDSPVCDAAYGLNSENCVCNSSCFFIYAGGVKRQGSVIGVHRPYYQKEQLQKMSDSAAMESSGEINNEVLEYLKSMSIPSSVIDKVLFTQSASLVFLTSDDMTKMNGFIPELKEWVVSQCGNYEEALGNLLILKAFNYELKKKHNQEELDSMFNKAHYELGKITECEKKVSQIMAKNAFKNFLNK